MRVICPICKSKRVRAFGEHRYSVGGTEILFQCEESECREVFGENISGG